MEARWKPPVLGRFAANHYAADLYLKKGWVKQADITFAGGWSRQLCQREKSASLLTFRAAGGRVVDKKRL